MTSLAQQFPSPGFQPARTQTIAELESLLGQLRQIEAEEVTLLNLAQDHNAQAAVYNELARIEQQQTNIMQQLAVVKKERVVEKARKIADDQRKLASLMQDAAEAEAHIPRSSSPGLNGRVTGHYTLRSGGSSVGLSNGTSRRSSQVSSSSGLGGSEGARLPHVRTGTIMRTSTRMAAPAQPENNGMEFKKRARPEAVEEEKKKDPEDDEPDFGKEAKRTKVRDLPLVSGGLPGFKIAKDLFTKRG